MRSSPFAMAAILIVLATIMGCAKSYTLSQTLTDPLLAPETCVIGTIEDLLPADQPAEQRLTPEILAQFGLDLATAINEERSLRMVESRQKAVYEVRAKVLAYEKVDGFWVSLFPFLINRARLTAHVELVHIESDQVVYGGKFHRAERTFIRPTAEAFRGIARDFASELSKQNRRLLR